MRLCTKAANLSHGMGMFLAQPLLEHMMVTDADPSTLINLITKFQPHLPSTRQAISNFRRQSAFQSPYICVLYPSICSQASISFLLQAIHRDSLRSNSGSGGVAVISDVRRVLELLVPLSAKPAMKAGLLELRAVSALAKVMHRIVQR